MIEKRFSNAVFYTVLLALAMLVADVILYALANPQATSERVNAIMTGSRENISTTLLGQIGVALLGVASSIGLLAALTNLKNKRAAALAVAILIITALAAIGVIRA
ncbi:hypothetical protein [Pyrobaculum calidifontis]|uniref:Uncharacterized protein n=1 Tax=Pyrobaculum calidifontis (strain DSM 21063 / JCM 11548 / VA1) TaxID=410359 RepID=A3MW23_PYRCJ|nr:hypothetical protein [Pyrobaculum calidifontis]ABO08840.1 hypothetical protein Pcal_1420 [Pyrobaculum calidifontis JCM 11548]